MRRIQRAAFCLLLLAPALLAQNDPFTLKIDVPVVSVDVVVSDTNGALVGDLDKADFQIYEEGAPQDIRFFSPVSAPYNIFLLFDRSESTRKNWAFMQNAVVEFIQNLRPQDRVALASFDNDYDVHFRWSADHTKAIRALDQIMKRREGSGTRFYDALDRTLRREFKNVVGRRAVVVLTDGQDTSYSWFDDGDLKKALKAAGEQRIPVYIVGLEDEANNRILLPRTRQYLLEVKEYMQKLADSSGGQLLFPKSLNDLGPMYEQLGRALGTSYSLGYIPAASSRTGAYRKIEVKARSSGLRLTQSRAGYVSK
jgi:Ca-activated chloride channel family protein